ncbi:MAG: sodium/proline symporter [Candidatus Aminicenantales bacterium]
MNDVTVAINNWALASFALYLGLMIAIGILTSRFSSSGIAEFFLGGRRMKTFVVALAAVTSGRSAWLLIAVAGMAFTRGISAIWTVVGYILMELFLFVGPGRRLRRFTGKMDDLTIPDFLVSRLQDQTYVIRLATVVPILIFMVSYVAAQFTAGAKTLATSFGANQTSGLLITAGIVVFYTMMGGFLAVCLTDVIQACLMIFALVVLPVLAVIHLGGFSLLLRSLEALNPAFIDPMALSIGTLAGFLGIGFGSPGNPHILNKHMSIDDPQKLPRSGIIATVWNVIMAWGAVYIGLAGRVVFKDVTALPNHDPENIYPLLASQHLHPFIYGLSISAIFAAIMSTADSQLLVASSAAVRDIYQKILAAHRPYPLSQKKLVFWSRAATLFLSLIALAMGFMAKKLVFYLVLFAWGGLGAALGPAVLLALYWPRLTKWGVFTGILTGTALEIIWYSIPTLKAVVSEWVPATIISFLTVVLVSLFTSPPEKAKEMLHLMGGAAD